MVPINLERDRSKKRILFITGTRADYGKIKSLLRILEDSEDYEPFIFVCGMHLLKNLGYTYNEVLKDGYKNIHVAYGILPTADQCANLGNTVSYLSGYVRNVEPDMIIIHGDRMDALAGAVVGALHNILVGHIEGGELSGTIDESIRHAISKFAHIHFVCTEEAKKRLIQMGEAAERIHIIGSPDIDIMMSNALPSLEEAKERYDIGFGEYAILMYHPVTTEFDLLGSKIRIVVDAVSESGLNYIVIYPNNDLGSEIILREYERLEGLERFRLFPSIRFEYFLTFLKNAKFMIGNSSAGVREAGIYGVPAIDIGTRQNGRYSTNTSKNIQHTNENWEEILSAIEKVDEHRFEASLFGEGESNKRFMDVISAPGFWDASIQKKFIDIDI